MATDFELLSAWSAGDAAAGNALFERHFAPLYRFFRNKVADGVDDLVQQTLLACVEGRVRFRQDSSFRTYMLAAARNILIRHCERKRRDAAIDLDEVSAHDLGTSPSSLLVRRAEERLVLEALRRIPLDDQIALELYYWEGLSGSELGRVLEIPEAAARSRVRRGMERLRDRLGAIAATPAELASTTSDLDRWARSLKHQLDAPESA